MKRSIALLLIVAWSVYANAYEDISFNELKQQYNTVLNEYCKDQYSDDEIAGRLKDLNRGTHIEQVVMQGLQAGWNDQNPYKAHWQWLRCDYAVFSQRLANPQLLGAMLNAAILFNDIDLARMLLHNEYTDSQESLAYAASAIKTWCGLQENEPDNSEDQQACVTARRMQQGLRNFHARKQAQRG